MTLRSLTLPAALGAAFALAGCGASAPAAERGPAAAPTARPDVDVTALTYPALGPIAQPDIREATLSNGIRVYVVEDPSLPLVRAQARVQGAGSLQDPADHVGLASIAGAVMRSGGAGDLDADALNLALESVGASVETFAADDATIATMRTLSSALEEVLPLLADVITAPRFAEDQVALAKTQQKAGISRRNDNPQGIATRELFRQLYGPDSPYTRNTEYWTVDAVDRQDVVDWHARYVAPEATSIAIWGDVDADAVIADLEAAFGDWQTPAGYTMPEKPVVQATDAPRVRFIEKTDVNQSTVLIGHLGEVRRDHPDYPALVVMNEILGGGFSSRLYKTIRTDLGLAYAVFGTYGANLDRPGEFYSGTFTQSGRTIEAARAMLDVIESMKTRAPSEQELSLAKDAYLNSFVFNFDTKSEVLSRRQTFDTYGYAPDFLEQLRQGVLAVTAEDVQRVAQEYLRPGEAVLLVLGNPDEFDEPVSALGAVEEIDITIPTTPPGQAAPAGDAAAGTAALEAVAEALGGAAAFDAIETMRTEGETAASFGGQDVTIQSTTTYGLPESIRAVQRLPVGEVTVILADGQGTLITPAGTQPAPPPIVGQIRSQLFLSLPYLLARRADLDVERMGEEGDMTVLQIRAPGVAEPFRLYVGPESRPMRLATTQVTPQGPADVEIAISDYRDVGGLMLPFAYAQTTNGEASGTTTLSRIEINPALDAGTFTTE